jgi:hypothetical protein
VSEAKIVTRENALAIANWCRGKPVVEHDALDHSITSPGINVPIKGGVKRASLGDMIIRNDDGTFEILKA